LSSILTDKMSLVWRVKNEPGLMDNGFLENVVTTSFACDTQHIGSLILNPISKSIDMVGQVFEKENVISSFT